MLDNWRTFIVAVLAMIAATAVLWQGLIDQDLWATVMGGSVGAYLYRSTKAKQANKQQEKV